MLKINYMSSIYHSYSNATPDRHIEPNAQFTFFLIAPIYWWVDMDYMRFGFELGDFSETEKLNMSVSTNISGYVTLTYQEIIDVCTDYVRGVFKYEKKPFQWNTEREWTDFCETLLDIKGVRDFVKEEN